MIHWVGGKLHRNAEGRAVAESVIAAFFGQAILVVSGVLVARALGVTDRGYLALLVLIPTTLALVGALGLPTAVTYFVSQQPQAARGIAASVVLPGVLQAASLVIIHAIALVLLFSADREEVMGAGLATLVAIPAALTYHYGLGLLQGLQLFRHWNLLGWLGPTLYSIAVIALVLLSAGQLVPIAIAWVTTSLVVSALIVVVVLRELPRPLTPAVATNRRAMLRFGMADLVASLSPVQRLRLDQAVVGLVLSPAALGLYVIGLAFTNLIPFIAQAIGIVGYPRVAANPDARDRRRLLWRYFLAAMVTCGLVFGVLEIAAGWLVPTFYGAEFVDAVLLTRILLLSALLLAGRRVLVDLARGAGNPGYGTWAEVASWVSLVPALLVLTPTFGVEGVAWAMVISATVSFCVVCALVAGDRGDRSMMRGGLG